jgi:hypothetical protein
MSLLADLKQKATTNVDIHLSLSPTHTIVRQMTKIILIKTKNIFSNLSKQWNFTNYRGTADTLHVYMNVVIIGKEETYIYVHFISC